MAWLKHLRAQVKSASTMASDARTSTLSSQSAGPPVTIIDPTPQDEVDRLLACAGPARGVVTRFRHDMSDGDRPIRTRVHVSVRPRLHDGDLGDEVAFSPWVSWKVAALLEPGLEIPVQLNRTTMRIDAIAIDHLAQELASRSDEAKRRHRGFDVDVGLEGISQFPGVVADLLRPPSGPAHPGPTVPSDDPTMAPIDGVSWQMFIAVRAEIGTRSSPEGFDAVAQRHGVAPGTWASADAAWMHRVMASPALATRLGSDLEAAQRALRDR